MNIPGDGGARARRNSARFPLLDRPMVTLYDSVGGLRFELWVPVGAKRSNSASAEVTYLLEANGDTLELAIEIVRARSIEIEVAFWRGLGDEIHRATPLVDGYVVTSIGNVDLNVVRHRQLGDGRAMHCWAQVRSRPQTSSERIVWAEAICSSLVVG